MKVKAVVGSIFPNEPDATFHCQPIPEGYAKVMVDEITEGFEDLPLEHPTGEGETRVGCALKTPCLWRKELINLPNWMPPPPPPPPASQGTPPPPPPPPPTSQGIPPPPPPPPPVSDDQGTRPAPSPARGGTPPPSPPAPARPSSQPPPSPPRQQGRKRPTAAPATPARRRPSPPEVDVSLLSTLETSHPLRFARSRRSPPWSSHMVTSLESSEKDRICIASRLWQLYC